MVLFKVHVAIIWEKSNKTLAVLQFINNVVPNLWQETFKVAPYQHAQITKHYSEVKKAFRTN